MLRASTIPLSRCVHLIFSNGALLIHYAMVTQLKAIGECMDIPTYDMYKETAKTDIVGTNSTDNSTSSSSSSSSASSSDSSSAAGLRLSVSSLVGVAAAAAVAVVAGSL